MLAQVYDPSTGECTTREATTEEIAEANALSSVSTDALWEALKAERERRKQGGFKFTVSGVDYWIHSDPGSNTQQLANKDTARDQLENGSGMAAPLLDKESGAQIVWKTLVPDGSPLVWLPLTCQLAFDMVDAAKGFSFALYRAAEQQNAAMLAAPDPAAYDFMQDEDKTKWPLIFGE